MKGDDEMSDSVENKRQIERLTRAVRMAGALASDIDIPDYSDRLTEECSNLLGAYRSFLFLVDEDSKDLFAAIFPPGKTIRIPSGTGIEGWVADTGEYVITDSPQSDTRFDSRLEDEIDEKIENLMVVPVTGARGRTLAVLESINKPGGFDSADFLMIRIILSQVAATLENTRLYRDLKTTFQSLIQVMAATIDARHPISCGHSNRVAKFAVGIAEEMGLPPGELEQIKIASLLHDYGKVGVHDSILRKGGELTDEEYRAVKEHVTITHNIVSKIHFTEELSDVATIASCHHERWDGKGYPFGLAGEAIPLGSRVISVADVFDAITSSREYRKARSYKVAYEEIISGGGKQFDPEVVEAFRRYYEKELEGSYPEEGSCGR